MDNTEFNSIKPSWNCKPLIRTSYKLLIFSLFASIFDTSNLSKSAKTAFVQVDWTQIGLDREKLKFWDRQNFGNLGPIRIGWCPN